MLFNSKREFTLSVCFWFRWHRVFVPYAKQQMIAQQPPSAVSSRRSSSSSVGSSSSSRRRRSDSSLVLTRIDVGNKAFNDTMAVNGGYHGTPRSVKSRDRLAKEEGNGRRPLSDVSLGDNQQQVIDAITSTEYCEQNKSDISCGQPVPKVWCPLVASS